MKFKTPIDKFLSKPEKSGRPCDFKGCKNVGEYRAPKSRHLKEYYWFCLEHVQAYNKEWNYYAGMSFEEAEKSRLSDILGERPTWPFGQKATHKILHFSVDDFIKGKDTINPTDIAPFIPKVLTKSQRHAMALLELEWPLDKTALKKAYKTMAKKYHPDLHGNDKSAEEKFKSIANAHQILINLLEGKN